VYLNFGSPFDLEQGSSRNAIQIRRTATTKLERSIGPEIKEPGPRVTQLWKGYMGIRGMNTQNVL